MCKRSDSPHTGAIPKTSITNLLTPKKPNHTDKNSPVALGCACLWLSLVWLGAGASGGCGPGVGASRGLVGLGFLFPFPFVRALTRRPPLFSQVSLWLRITAGTQYVSMFWDFGSLHQKHRVGGTQVVYVVTGQMVGDRRFPGTTTLGVHVPPTIRCQSRRQVQNILTHLGVDSVRDGRLSTSRWVPFLGFVLGLRFTLPEALRRHFFRAVAAAVFLVFVAMGFRMLLAECDPLRPAATHHHDCLQCVCPLRRVFQERLLGKLDEQVFYFWSDSRQTLCRPIR